MASQKIREDRIKTLNDLESQPQDYVLYWMQQAQRAEHNPALEFAVQRANELGQPLLVGFGLTDDYPEANLRHYRFMLEGLQQVATAVRRRNIGWSLQLGKPAEVALRLGKRASEIVCDRGYLRHQRQWRKQVANEADCRVWQVETDTIVPVETASDKQEYAARTIRSKLNDHRDEYLRQLSTTAVDHDATKLNVDGVELDDLDALLGQLDLDRSVAPVEEFSGGTAAARQRLQDFTSASLSQYDSRKSVVDPHVSFLSPYLHFGQISPVQIALAIESKRGVARAGKDAFLEELLVRRELAINFVFYQSNYDSLKCLPDWASETLAEHEDDSREHQYTSSQLESAETHDEAWNAAMTEMKNRGYLHNHLRMYWGKKIIQWTNTTGHAFRTTLALNNKYFLDGRDANSFANVAWLFGLHDRAHQERPVFGKVRYMSYDGLRRKIDVDAYVEQIHQEYGEKR